MSWHDHRGHVSDFTDIDVTEVSNNPYLKPICSWYTQQERENDLKILRNLDPDKLYFTERISRNGDTTLNTVLGKDLIDHINYNQFFRFGQALFINGACVHRGYDGIVKPDVFFKELNPKHSNRQTSPFYR